MYHLKESDSGCLGASKVQYSLLIMKSMISMLSQGREMLHDGNISK